jgi:hypothetical protein
VQPPRIAITKPLPPLDKDATCICIVAKKYKYISLVPVDPVTGEQRNDLVLTLHQVEAKKLGQALIDAASRPALRDFTLNEVGSVEGLYVGGPPEKNMLSEFNDKG